MHRGKSPCFHSIIWKPLTEVPKEKPYEPLDTDRGDDQARAPETLEAPASQLQKLVFTPDQSKSAGSESMEDEDGLVLVRGGRDFSPLPSRSDG